MSLPSYSPSAAVPFYVPEPAHDEQRLEHTPRARSRHTGNYIKQCGRDAVILIEQDPNAEFPTYGRLARINGFVSVEERETVSEIVLKMKGKMDVMIVPEAGARTTDLVNTRHTVWSSVDSPSACPSAVPFSVTLPSSFRDYDGGSHPLPPSYDIPRNIVVGLLLKMSYTLSVTITRTRSVQFLHKQKTISTPFVYRITTRPWRSFQPFSDFMSDIKTSPDEFRQVLAEMKPRPGSSAQPIDLHLFLPTVETFGLEDTIPFYIQLTGPVASLREFLAAPHDPCGRTTTILVSLVRQITVELNGRTASRNIVVGEANLCSRPPDADMHDGVSLDWDGEVRSRDPDSMVGMFDAGCVRVQDFLVIELHPPETRTTREFTSLRHAHPIKLVTDSWLDPYTSAT
ncbi:hypothetical protein C8R46DRAFT_265452 [Mycena filopes]|nr:hypothetical protein C8R46DRAFT_265452 [Mycena filopes]